MPLFRGLLLPIAALTLQAQSLSEQAAALDRTLASCPGIGWVLEVHRPSSGRVETRLLLRGAGSLSGNLTPTPALAGASIKTSLEPGMTETRGACDLPAATLQAFLDLSVGGATILTGTPLPAPGETLLRTWAAGLISKSDKPIASESPELEIRLEPRSGHELLATLEVHHGSVDGIVLQELQRSKEGRITASQLPLTCIAPPSKGIVRLSGPLLISGPGARLNLRIQGHPFNTISIDIASPTQDAAPTIQRVPLR